MAGFSPSCLVRHHSTAIDISDFSDWGDPERLAANVVAAYRELDPQLPAPTPPELFMEMARWRAAH